MPGEYSDEDLLNMTPKEIAAAVERGWKKPVADRPEYAGVPVPRPQPKPEPRGDVWMSQIVGSDIFTCPSGQTCRLRPLEPDQLLIAGILDKVTRLEGLAQVLVNQAEGMPPEKQRLPSREEFAELLEVINLVVPLTVVEPTVLPDPKPGEEYDPKGLYVSRINLADRLAIMNKALEGVKALDNFRHS